MCFTELCGDVKLFIARGWVLEVLLGVHCCPSSACWLQKQTLWLKEEFMSRIQRSPARPAVLLEVL